jgi:hypothetical protein
MFDLEAFLDLTQITPLQSSYTQTAEDRNTEEKEEETKSDETSKSGIEPPANENSEDNE